MLTNRIPAAHPVLPPDPMVRVTRAVCIECGYESPGMFSADDSFQSFPADVPADEVRQLSTRGHSDGKRYGVVCRGQVQFEMEPVDAD